MKLLVAVGVSREWVESEFLRQMGTWRFPENWQVRIGWFQQFTAAERHNIAMKEAEYNYDRILFMDTDQVYPPDYIEMMLQHDEPVVSALNVSRYHPFEFCCYNLDGSTERYGIDVPKLEPIQPPQQRIFECDVTGTGAMMLDVKVLKDLELPYFKDVFEKEGCVRLIPDDFYFGLQLHKAGYRVTVDQGIIAKHIAKVLAAPYNVRDLRRAWTAVNRGYGYWKDGKK